MGKASHQCTGSRSRERHQENLRVFLVVCFKCGTFSLTKEKMSFLAIFGRYHTLFLGFLAKKVFLFENIFKIFFYKRVICVVKKGDFWMIFGENFLVILEGDFRINFWEKDIFLWSSSWKILETPFENFSLDLFEESFSSLGKVLEPFERVFLEKDFM